MTNVTPPAPRIETEQKQPLWKRVSLVWAIPLVALIVAAVVTFQTRMTWRVTPSRRASSPAWRTTGPDAREPS